MALQFTNTSDVSVHYLKVLVHGPAGSGKTRLAGTTGAETLIISAEAGLLSLRNKKIDVFTVKDIAGVREVYEYLLTDKKYQWVVLDSISEIGEVVLNSEMEKTKDPRKAYGETANVLNALIRCFRDLPKNVYVSAKQERTKDETTGQLFWGASMPGQKLGPALPYFFDEVFAMRTKNVTDENGNIDTKYALQTRRDDSYEAKDRSGVLANFEEPDLSAIYDKIINQVQGE